MLNSILDMADVFEATAKTILIAKNSNAAIAKKITIMAIVKFEFIYMDEAISLDYVAMSCRYLTLVYLI